MHGGPKNYIYNSFEFNTWHLNNRKLIIKLAGRLLPKSLWYFFAGVDVPMEIKMFGPKSAVKQFAWISFIPQSSFRKAIPAVWSRGTSCRGADHLRSVWIGWECVPLGRELSPIPAHARSCQSSPGTIRVGPLWPVQTCERFIAVLVCNERQWHHAITILHMYVASLASQATQWDHFAQKIQEEMTF